MIMRGKKIKKELEWDMLENALKQELKELGK